jgi:soluble lytic murein transglycosylase
LLAADAYLKLGKPDDAVRVLREYYAETTAPQSDMALADAYLAAGDKTNAVAYYQRVYFGYPQSPAGPRALAAMNQLKTTMGGDYPPAMPFSMLGRAVKLLEAGQATSARSEFEALIPQLGGAERDLARVRIGAALYAANQSAAALDYFTKLQVDADEPDAERLYYMAQAARRLGRLDDMDAFAMRAHDLYPRSPWAVDALIAAGNRHLTEHDVAKYEALYQACYTGAPSDPDAHLCHWKVTWIHYMRREADAALLLREQLKNYPASEEASAALYFLGRLANDTRTARTYFTEAATEYPNVFYAGLARQRLATLPTAQPAEPVTAFLKTVAFPLRSRAGEFTMTPNAQLRIERAELLAKAGQSSLAEAELRFGAEAGEQPQLLGMEIAKVLSAGDPAKGLRYIKRYARGYLLMPIATAPKEFWKLAFPLPFRASLDKHTQQYGVDTYLMAALIRQESEFDPQAVSVTDARGLSQIEPATGRDLSGRLHVTYTLPKLFQPDFNIQLGAFYFDWLTKQLGGNTEAALASYNAGLSRAKTWLKWDEYREPAEFIESVPITQTREYIQAVLRNAAAYREIYGAPQK